jgi:hypothetical protein
MKAISYLTKYHNLISIFYSILLWLYSSFVGPWQPFQFLNVYTVGRTPWTGDQPVARSLPTHRTTQTQNKRTQTSMPRVRFEPTTQVLERAKTVHALDRSATVIGTIWFLEGISRMSTCKYVKEMPRLRFPVQLQARYITVEPLSVLLRGHGFHY